MFPSFPGHLSSSHPDNPMDGLARPLPVFLTMLVTLASEGLVRADGILDQVRREVSGTASRPARERDADDDRDDDDCHDDWHDDDDSEHNGLTVFFGQSFLYALSAPWRLPHWAVGDDLANWGEFSSAPYADHEGFLLIESAAPGRVWSARLSAESATDFDDLSRIGTRLIVDTSSRLGFDTEWNQWIERVPGGHDTLATGDFNLVVRFAQHERIEFHSGIGVNWLADAHDSDFGFNFTYGVDLFPCEPWVVSSTIDWGTLGEASLFHSRTSVGLIFGAAEIFTGFDYQRIGDADLHGLTAGVRFWY